MGTMANGTGSRCESSGNKDTWNDGFLSVVQSCEPSDTVSYSYEIVPCFINTIVVHWMIDDFQSKKFWWVFFKLNDW